MHKDNKTTTLAEITMEVYYNWQK